MIKINGKLVPASLLAQCTVNNNQNLRVRQQMLQELKNKTIVKKGGNIDLDKLRSTFQTTDLMSKEKGKKHNVNCDDALAQDIDGEQDFSIDGESDDSEFREEEPEQQVNAVWDEEENIQSVKNYSEMNSQDELDAC